MENNFNDVCLWVQAESINDNDIVIKDGRILPSGNEHQKLSTYAIAIQSNYERIGEVDNVKIYQIPHIGYMIMSNLIDTDKVNRRRAFSGVVKRQSFEECWNLLKETLQANNLSINEEDYKKIVECINKYNEKKKLSVNIKIFLSIMIGLIILLVVLKRVL